MKHLHLHLRAWAAWLLLLAGIAGGGAAHAELRALLVGVSGYPTLPERYRLTGPRNDVLRMRQVLLLRGFQPAHIELLADGVAGAALPTRAGILAALGRLAAAAQAGDTVFIHFAGHGSRQPAEAGPASARRPELQEIFLPLDVGAWDGGQRRVVNAIVNHELRAAVDRIIERGSFVWGVFDSCHSAALVRGTEGTELRYRHVEPAALGIDHAGPAPTSGGAAMRGTAAVQPTLPQGPLGPSARSASASGGGSAFFYATQADELTPELLLPPDGAPRRVHGLFSFVLARALERAQPMSYRQLGQFILSEYGAIAEARATPMFTGNGLDTLVLGQRSRPLQQWPLVAGAVPAVAAGSLHGIEAGAVLAVLPGPLAGADEVIGHLQVTSASADRAELAPVAHGGKPAPAASALRAFQYLRLVSSPPQFTLRVALDRRGCPAECALADAVAGLRQQGTPGVDIAWVTPAAGADIVLRQVAGRVIFQPPTQQADDEHARAAAPGLPLREPGPAGPRASDGLSARLARELHVIARARNLLRVASQLAAEPTASPMVASLQRMPAGGRAAEDLAEAAVPALKDGDKLVLQVENLGPLGLDLTVLYLDAEHGIQALFPNRLGESNRLEPGTRKAIDGIEIHAPPAGIERLMLIAVPARRHGERADFSFLQQAALTHQRGDRAQEDDVFADAAFADYRHRGAARPAAPRQGTLMQMFTVNVQR